MKYRSLIVLLLILGGLEGFSQRQYNGQYNLGLAQLNPTHDGERSFVPLIPIGLARTVFFTNELFFRYNFQYAYRNYRSACLGCSRSVISRDRFDQVEVSTYAFYDRGTPYQERRVDLLVGAGIVTQFVFNEHTYTDLRSNEYSLDRNTTWLALYLATPIMLSVQLKGPFRLEVGSEMRFGVQRLREDAEYRLEDAGVETALSTQRDAERFRVIPYPIYISLGMLVGRKKKEDNTKKVEGKINDLDIE